MGLWPTHPESVVPIALPTSYQHRQVYRGDEPRYMACRLPARLPSRWIDDDHFIIQYLPIYLGEHVRAWLEFVLHDSIRDWADLKRIFVGIFLRMYVRPGNSWDLKSC